MKRFLVLFTLVGLLLNSQDVHAAETDMIKGYATAYNQTGTMATGSETRKGVCAGATEYSEKMIVLYQRLPDGSMGDYIGMYECLDTGGTDGLKSGVVIDVWQPSLDAVQDFADITYANECKGRVYIQIIDAKG